MNFDGTPERRGSAGRIPDKISKEKKRFLTQHYTCPPDLVARLEKFCADEERAKSWVIQKALDMWLSKKGY